MNPKPPCLFALIILGGLAFTGTGCGTTQTANAPIKGKVIGGNVSLTKLGVTENLFTGAYELGTERGQLTGAVVPMYYDPISRTWSSPDFVMSYEAQARNGMFGSAGGTFTYAIGSNAVWTMLGGNHLPINFPLATAQAIGVTVPAPGGNGTGTGARAPGTPGLAPAPAK